MRFEEKYQAVPVGELGDDTYLRTDIPGECCVCGRPCYFAEINYEAFLCSEECENVLEEPLRLLLKCKKGSE